MQQFSNFQNQNLFIDEWQPKGWIAQSHKFVHSVHSLNKRKFLNLLVSEE